MALWLPPSGCFHEPRWPLSLGLWNLSAEQGLVCRPQTLSQMTVREAGATRPSSGPGSPKTLFRIPHLGHILKRQGGGDTGPSGGRCRGQTCRIKEKKQSFPRGGRQRPSLLEADRNDQRTRMVGRGCGKEPQRRQAERQLGAGAVGSDRPGLGSLAGCPEPMILLGLGPHLHNGQNVNSLLGLCRGGLRSIYEKA